MHVTQLAQKLRAQIQQFLGVISPRFSKPKAKFIEQMLLGIAAAQDCKLSQIARSLNEPITLKKTEERLSHHLAEAQLGAAVQAQVVAQAARRISEETLIVIDPTDVRKDYAQAMPYLARVRDGSSGELANGYWCGVALACESNSRKVIPLLQQLWSAAAPDFQSENTQLLQMIRHDCRRHPQAGRLRAGPGRRSFQALFTAAGAGFAVYCAVSGRPAFDRAGPLAQCARVGARSKAALRRDGRARERWRGKEDSSAVWI